MLPKQRPKIINIIWIIQTMGRFFSLRPAAPRWDEGYGTEIRGGERFVVMVTGNMVTGVWVWVGVWVGVMSGCQGDLMSWAMTLRRLASGRPCIPQPPPPRHSKAPRATPLRPGGLCLYGMTCKRGVCYLVTRYLPEKSFHFSGLASRSCRSTLSLRSR